MTGQAMASSHLSSCPKSLTHFSVFVDCSGFGLALPEHYRVPVLALAHVHGC